MVNYMNAETIKKDVEIIKPYLNSKGLNLTLGNKKDSIVYFLTRFENKRHLKVEYLSYDKVMAQRYQIVYDINGNILLDCINCSSNGDFNTNGNEVYYENKQEEIFIDSNNIILEKILNSQPVYTLYMLNSGRYKEIHTFTKADFNNYKGGIFVPNIRILKTANNDFFINYGGKLYSLSEYKYLNNLEFNDIFDYTELQSPYSCWRERSSELINESSDEIKKILKKNNLLYASTTINAKYNDITKHSKAFVYLDTKGNIVSKLYLELKNTFVLIDVANDTYDNILEKCKELIVKEIKNDISREKRAKARAKTLELKNKKNMLETISNSYK